MDDLLAALAATEIAAALRHSRWGYAAVSALHILGFALLAGAIVPLDLRLTGLIREPSAVDLVRVLAPAAAAGLLLAVATGALLFSVRAPEYARNPAFLVKAGLVAIAVVSAAVHHARFGAHLRHASKAQRSVAGGISLCCWIGALVAGRLIAFVED